MKKITFIKRLRVGESLFLRFRVDSWTELTNGPSVDYLTFSPGHIKVKGDSELKPNHTYEILAYKICHDSNVLLSGNCILGGHTQGHIDWMVTGMMERFIKHQRYYLMKILIEEVKNDQ